MWIFAASQHGTMLATQSTLSEPGDGRAQSHMKEGGGVRGFDTQLCGLAAPTTAERGTRPFRWESGLPLPLLQRRPPRHLNEAKVHHNLLAAKGGHVSHSSLASLWWAWRNMSLCTDKVQSQHVWQVQEHADMPSCLSTSGIHDTTTTTTTTYKK